MQNYRRPVSRPKVVLGIVQVIIYRLGPENNYFGDSAQEGKNSLNIEFLGVMFLGHQGPRRRDTKIAHRQLANFHHMCRLAYRRDPAIGISFGVSQRRA